MTLVDDRAVTKEALSANFLIPSDENVCAGKTLTELCRDSLKDFNPMVRVSVEKGLASSATNFQYYWFTIFTIELNIIFELHSFYIKSGVDGYNILWH